MGPLAVLDAAGTPAEIGLAHGRRFAREIARAAEVAARRGPRGAAFRAAARRACAAARRFSPAAVDEIAAIAEGAGLPFDDVFRLNWLEGAAVAPEKCTTIALRTRRGVLLAQNEDWAQGNDVFLLRARYPDGGGFLCLTYRGILPGISCGRNAHGIVHAVNHVHPADRRVGVPRDVVARAVLDARTLAEAERLARTPGQGYGQVLHLAQGRRYLRIEVSARRVSARRPPLPSAHTNHYIDAAMRAVEGADRPVSSVLRLWAAERALARLAAAGRPPTARDALRILASEETAPWSIWRSGRHPEDHAVTVATAIAETDGAGLRVWRGRPDRGPGRFVPFRGGA